MQFQVVLQYMIMMLVDQKTSMDAQQRAPNLTANVVCCFLVWERGKGDLVIHFFGGGDEEEATPLRSKA
jgi:hypothetical protein